MDKKGRNKLEYVFGTVLSGNNPFENLKTVGDEHTDLKNYMEIRREYDDCTITDRFKVVRHYASDLDSEGNCYDWYQISDHYRIVDKSEQLKAENAVLQEKLSATQKALDELILG